MRDIVVCILICSHPTLDMNSIYIHNPGLDFVSGFVTPTINLQIMTTLTTTSLHSTTAWWRQPLRYGSWSWHSWIAWATTEQLLRRLLITTNVRQGLYGHLFDFAKKPDSVVRDVVNRWFYQELEAKFIWSQDLFGNAFLAKAGKAFLLPHWKRFWRSWNLCQLCMLMRWRIFCSTVDLRLLRRVRSGELSGAVVLRGRCLRYTRRSRTKKGAKSSFVLLHFIQLSRDFMLMKGALHNHHTSNLFE